VQAAKEDWESGTKSALAGGVTIVVDQPNTVPPVNTPETLRARVFDAKEKAFCHFEINSSVTHGTPLSAMWSAGAMAFGEIFFGPSSYGEAVTPQDLKGAFDQIHSLGGLATIHAEEKRSRAWMDHERITGGKIHSRGSMTAKPERIPRLRTQLSHP
jgi:dihydroorotase